MTLPKCMLCKYFIGNKDDLKMRCKAFPDGIPKDVLWEEDDKECNNGIKFETE